MRRKLIIAGSIALVACGVVPGTVATMVARQAERAAAGRAYCVQIADEPSDYRAATSLVDFSAYIMRARVGEHGLHPSFHAVLFAERAEAKQRDWGQPVYERFNWSYRQLRFLPIVGQGHAALGDAPDCVPAQGFALALPVFGFSHAEAR